LATRRVGAGAADHGAQFFTARSATFRLLVDDWLAAQVAYHWSNGFSGGQPNYIPDGHPRYAVHGGMNALAKHLAAGLPDTVNVRVNVKLTTLAPIQKGWQAQDETGEVYTARAVLLTPPVPQSLALLGDNLLNDLDQVALERVEYAPCMAGLFRVNGDVNLPEPGALQRPDDPISWIADNQRKGISPDEKVITVHAGPGYSRQIWDIPDALALPMLQATLQPLLAAGAAIVEGQLKRWRYALPTVLHPARYLLAANLPPLVFAGDAFAEARIEGAALSGMAAATVLSEPFKI
jgi:predicted NAD/FAD-dependent oxidoreductase